MRSKLRWLPGSWLLQRPQHEQAAADLHAPHRRAAKASARSAKAFGIDVGYTRPSSIRTNSISRTGARSGSSQLVSQAVVDPGPPHGQHQQRGLQRAERGEVLEQAVRELGDGEHEDEVEEQLDEGDAAVAVPHPQVTGARGNRHRCPLILSLDTASRAGRREVAAIPANRAPMRARPATTMPVNPRRLS